MKSNGAVVWSASYTAFGQATVEVETVTNNLRFPGQYADAETGLHYNFHRYYAPGIGRYVQIDPIGFSREFHIYVYAKLNPVIFMDVTGEYPVCKRCSSDFGLGAIVCPFHWLTCPGIVMITGGACAGLCYLASISSTIATVGATAGSIFLCTAICTASTDIVLGFISALLANFCLDDRMEEYQECVKHNEEVNQKIGIEGFCDVYLLTDPPVVERPSETP